MGAWEVRDGDNGYCVERGTTRDGDWEMAAAMISDYGLACLIEAACNMRDGTVE